jgi:hypothetical protein
VAEKGTVKERKATVCFVFVSVCLFFFIINRTNAPKDNKESKRRPDTRNGYVFSSLTFNVACSSTQQLMHHEPLDVGLHTDRIVYAVDQLFNSTPGVISSSRKGDTGTGQLAIVSPVSNHPSWLLSNHCYIWGLLSLSEMEMERSK